MITVELSDDIEQLHIHLDDQGRKKLLKILNDLKPLDHEHLMTPNWGGNELSDEQQGERCILLNAMTIHLW